MSNGGAAYSFGTIEQGIALNSETLPGFAIAAILYYGKWVTSQLCSRIVAE